MLSNVKVVLCRTSHPGNIGAAARAAKTMSLQSLCLVNPWEFPSAEATRRASGAADLLDNAQVCDDLSTAVADCQLVFAASARSRTIKMPEMDARSAAEKIASLPASTKVAVVFGQERSGLSNDEIELCHTMVKIPANPEYTSLNMASAVQLICYEIQMAHLSTHERLPVHAETAKGEELANQKHFDSFIGSWLDLIEKIDFGDEKQSFSLKSRIRRVFMRAELTTYEVDLLRGMISAIGHKLG